MGEVDATTVAGLVPLTPGTSAGSGTSAIGNAAADATLELTDWCNGALILLGCHCCHLLDE